VEGLRKVLAPGWEKEYAPYMLGKSGADEEARKALVEAAAKKVTGGKGKAPTAASRYEELHRSTAVSRYHVFKPSAALTPGLTEYENAQRTLSMWWRQTAAASHEVFCGSAGLGTASAVHRNRLSAYIEAQLATSDALEPARRLAPSVALGSFPSAGLQPLFNPPAVPSPAGAGYAIYSAGGYADMYGGSYGYGGGTGGVTTAFAQSIANVQRSKQFELAACMAETRDQLVVALDALKASDLEETG
jgi:hypothetical protein